MIEILICVLSIIHPWVQLKWRKIKFETLYIECAAGFLIGILCLIYLCLCDKIYNEKGIFESIFFIIQPIDIIFISISLLISTILLDFLTRTYQLNRNGLLVIIPWTFTAQYRFLHELIWVFHYWITMNITEIHGFSDLVTWYQQIPFFGKKIPPALLTHTYAILFMAFSIFNFVIILRECMQRKESK